MPAVANVRDDSPNIPTPEDATDQKNSDQKKMEAAISAAGRARATKGGASRASVDETPYQVRAGDTMWAVAQSHKDSLGKLLKANPQIANADRIRPGDILFVPTKDAASVETRTKVADAEASEHSAAGLEAVLRNPKLSPAMRNSLTEKLAAAQGEASSKWAALQKSVEDELRKDGVEKGLSEGATASFVAAIRARAPDSGRFQKAVDAALQTEQNQAQVNRQVHGIVGDAQAQTASLATLDKDYADAAKNATDELRHDPGALKTVVALDALNKGYAKAPDNVKAALLHDPATQKIIADAVAWANDPLQHPGNAISPSGQTAAALERLDTATHGLDKTLAGIVVDRAVAGYEKFHAEKEGNRSNSGPYTTTLLMKLGGRIAGTPQSDDAVKRFATIGHWNTDAVRNAVGAGEDPAYAIAVASQMKARGPNSPRVVQTIADGIAMRDQEKIADGGSVTATIDVANRLQTAGLDGSPVLKVAIDGMQQFKEKTTADVKKLAAHDAELAWLVQNDGAALTPQQLVQAVAKYRLDKGPAWQADEAKLSQQIANDGSKLLAQMTALNELPPSLSGSRAAANQTLRTIANDPAAGLAISNAIATDPELAEAKPLGEWADVFTLAKVGDIGRKYTTEGASAFLRRNVLGKLQGTDFSNPKSLAEAKDALRSLHNETFAGLIGVTKSESEKLVKALNSTADKIGAAKNEEEVASILRGFDKDIRNDALLSKTFNKATVAGQVLRSVALVFAGASLVNSYSKYSAKPSDPQNQIKLALDGTGSLQKISELLTGLGVVSKDSDSAFGRGVAQFGGEWKLLGRASASDLLAGASAAFDGYSAYHSAKEHQYDSAFFSGSTALGGVLTVAPAFGAAAWLGPVGLGITAVAVIGKAIYLGEKDAHKYEAASKSFLKAAGYNDVAADALSKQEGSFSGATGAAQLPLLAKYAALKHMTSDHLTHWVNSLTADQANNLAKRLLQATGDAHGDADQFTDGPPQITYVGGDEGGFSTPLTLANTVGVFEDYLNFDHVPHP